jgi:hypothetical protein
VTAASDEIAAISRRAEPSAPSPNSISSNVQKVNWFLKTIIPVPRSVIANDYHQWDLEFFLDPSRCFLSAARLLTSYNLQATSEVDVMSAQEQK